jgi:hypothetical protein
MNLLDAPFSSLHIDRRVEGNLDPSEVHERQRQLDQVIRAVGLARGVSYADAYQLVADGAREAADAGRPLTVRGALQAMGADPEGVGEQLKALDAATAQIEKTFDDARAPRLETDGACRVLLDQKYGGRPKALSADGVPLDAADREDRLRRARRLNPSAYDGEQGRRRWELEDSLHLRAGLDVLKSGEMARGDELAGTQAAGHARQLSQQIELDAKTAREVKQLDEQAGEIAQQRRELQASTPDGLKLLDAPKKKGEKKARRKQLIDAMSARGYDDDTINAMVTLDARITKRVRRTGISRSEAAMWEAEGVPMPPKPKGLSEISQEVTRELKQLTQARAPDARSGGDPDAANPAQRFMLENADLNGRIQKYAREQGIDYQQAVEQFASGKVI